MKNVTGKDCQDVVAEKGFKTCPIRECSICGGTLLYHFAYAKDVLANPKLEGFEPEELIAGFDRNCRCVSYDTGITITSWEDIANIFNIQTPEHRSQMWERYIQGKLLYQ